MEHALKDVLTGRKFLECPRWHEGRLWISDMRGHEVLSVGPDGDARVEIEFPGQPSGMGWMPDGTLLIGSLKGRVVMRWRADRGLELHADLTSLTVGGTNDMIVDDQGRGYIGSFGFDLFGGAPEAPGNIVRVDPDGSARVVADGLAFPNGMVILPGGRQLVVSESYGERLTAFDIGEDGGLSNGHVIVECGTHTDGICLDAESAIWVAQPDAQRWVRVQLDGKVTDTIQIDGRRAIACWLGGPDGHTFYGVTHRIWTDDTGKERGESKLETTRVAVPGVVA